MRGVLIGVLFVMVGFDGCGRKSAILLERKARGELSDIRSVGSPTTWVFQPLNLSKDEAGLHITVGYASREFQQGFFANRAVFGEYAGKSPYAAEHLVFYVTVVNQTGKRVGVDPAQFVLVDDLGNQYSPVGTDPVIAFTEVRRPIASTTRGILQEASPGYFGFSVPVGKMFVKAPQGPLALLRQSSLQTGYLHSGVVHDGLVAFWNPAPAARKLTFIATGLKMNFDAKDWPETSLEFVFEFEIAPQP